MRKAIVGLTMFSGALALLYSLAGAQESSQPEFNYIEEGSKGPPKWYGLKEGWGDCQDRPDKPRSPIVFGLQQGPPQWGDTVGRVLLDVRYSPMQLKLKKAPFTVDVVASGNNSFVDRDGTAYTLDQFHFHYPSEHYDRRTGYVSQGLYEMELHMVHVAPGERKAVLAIFVRADSPTANTVLEPIFSRLADLASAKESEKSYPGVTINPHDLVKDFKNKAYYHYTGSLTTPPCTPGVRWLILGGALSISQAQLATYKQTFKVQNSRGFYWQRPQATFGLCCDGDVSRENRIIYR